MDLLKVSDIEDAQDVLIDCIREFPPKEIDIEIAHANGRIISQDLFSGEDVPSFRRSTVDGYAVISSSVSVASDSVPVFLEVIGSVEMGEAADFSISNGECAYVPTGGAIPHGADSMIMIEFTENFGKDKISIFQSAAKGDHIINIGEDVKMGDPIVSKGTVITPQITGVLAAAGFGTVRVYEPLRIAILSTGDELIPPDAPITPGKIRNVNTYSISAQAEKIGYEVISMQALPDIKEEILSAVKSLMNSADIICLSGGSSKGKKDFTAEIIDESGDPGAIIHGLAVKPGKPTIIGYDRVSKTIMTGLPGHPVSSFIIFELLFGELFRKYTGIQAPMPYYAKISQNLASSPGKTTCVPVKLVREAEDYMAVPVFGKSGLISTLSNADGYIIIGKNDEGLNKGGNVTVYLI